MLPLGLSFSPRKAHLIPLAPSSEHFDPRTHLPLNVPGAAVLWTQSREGPRGLVDFPRRLLLREAQPLQTQVHTRGLCLFYMIWGGVLEDRVFPGTLISPVWSLHSGRFWPRRA